MLDRKIDEVKAIYQIYKLYLKKNEKKAVIVYIALLMGILIHCLLILTYGFFVHFIVTFFIYQVIVICVSYNLFRDIYLELHSPS